MKNTKLSQYTRKVKVLVFIILGRNSSNLNFTFIAHHESYEAQDCEENDRNDQVNNVISDIAFEANFHLKQKEMLYEQC